MLTVHSIVCSPPRMLNMEWMQGIAGPVYIYIYIFCLARFDRWTASSTFSRHIMRYHCIMHISLPGTSLSWHPTVLTIRCQSTLNSIHNISFSNHCRFVSASNWFCTQRTVRTAWISWINGNFTRWSFLSQVEDMREMIYGKYRIHSNRHSCPDRRSPPFIIELLAHKSTVGEIDDFCIKKAWIWGQILSTSLCTNFMSCSRSVRYY